MYFEGFNIESRRADGKYRCPGLPDEFRGISLEVEAPSHTLKRRLLLLLAEKLIRAGNAIKTAQLRVNEQKFLWN